MLNFRGLSFYFPIESKFQPGYAHGLGSLQFPNGTSPLVAKTAIYFGSMGSGAIGSDENSLKTPPPPLPLVYYLYNYHHSTIKLLLFFFVINKILIFHRFVIIIIYI